VSKRAGVFAIAGQVTKQWNAQFPLRIIDGHRPPG
jgi:hypothetical protein